MGWGGFPSLSLLSFFITAVYTFVDYTTLLCNLSQFITCNPSVTFPGRPINLKPARPEGAKTTYTPVGPDQQPCNFLVHLHVNVNSFSFPSLCVTTQQAEIPLSFVLLCKL